MPKLSDLDKEIIRRAPKGSVYRLAALFGCSRHTVKQIRNGSRGLPQLNGLGMRPWDLRNRELVAKWHRLYLARGEAARRRALEAIDKDEALRITLEPVISRDETLALVPGEPGSLVLFKGALTIKPHAAPPPSPAPVLPKPAPSEPGVFYDRPSARRNAR